MKEAKIDSFIARLNSRAEIDDSVLRDELNLFLSEEFKDIVNYMNNVFFANESSLLVFMKSSINQGSKQQESVRKMLYEFISEYIIQYAETLTEYIYGMFRIIYNFFLFETAPRPKQFSLIPLVTIIEIYDTRDLLSQKVLQPQELHNSLVNSLKCQKFLPSVKGNIWLLISTIQGKFTTMINQNRKRQVQQMCLYDIKFYVNENKNFSTIAAILRSFKKSLQEVLLNQDEMKDLFRYLCTLIKPLAARYDVPINALQLLSERSTVFHQLILDNGNKIFSELCGLLNHNNRQFVFQVNDTLDDVTKQIVKGIQQNSIKYQPLYQVIISKSWSMLQQHANYQIKGSQSAKQKYKYNIVTILKILGTISPLVKHYQTPQELHRFFNQILTKCSKKLNKAFKPYQNTSQEDIRTEDQQTLIGRNKMHIKFVLYNQKELVSFISALSQIIYNINSLTQYEENQLIKIILISIEQYPRFYDKYLGNLTKVLVQLFKVLQIKSFNPFYHVLKRVVSSGFKIMLNSKKFNVNTDQEYYQMIKKTIKFWLDLINHQNWSQNSLLNFGNILFQFFQTMIEYLDISYKSNLQIQIEENADLIDDQNGLNEQNLKNPNQQKEDIAKTFFLAVQTMRISNLEEYQYMHSLVLVFEGILSHLSNFNYSPRMLEFYKKVVERIRVFPKSVSLMKVIRALNSYLVRISSLIQKTKTFQEQKKENRESEGYQIQSSQLNDYCMLAKKLYNETIEHYLQKHQEECLYECLKMLTSFPVQVFLYDRCEILRTNLSYIIKKCFQLGQQIISIADSAIDCLKRMFDSDRAASQKYLIDVIPKMEKFIWLSGQGQEDFQLQSSKKIYLFVDQMKITKDTLAKKIMDFLGSIGGLVHLLVDTSGTNKIAWDYQDALQIEVLMGTFKCNLNLSRLLNRVCFLALNGQLYIKRAACEFLHSIFTLVIGNAAEYKSPKEVTANFLDKIFPTILEISSNSSHPSQQLIHTILIQSIRFFSLTQQPNSPDISTILKHLLQLYNGSEDMSCLGSKCIAQLVRWHIKSDTRNKKELKNYPIIKVIMRNIWTLTSNKKAKNGLILLLVQLLREIHREEDLMKIYAIQICSIIINIGRSNQPIEKQFNYLIEKLVLSLNKVIRKLIIQDKKYGDQFKKYSTIHKFLEQIYETNFFSIYSQQREISFILWKSIITKYSHVLNYTCLDFLRNKADRNKLYLFSKITKPLEKFSQKEIFTKLQSKMIAFCDVWRKMLEFEINSAQNLARFKDIEEIVIQSYVNLTGFLILQFQQFPSEQRCLNQEAQLIFIQAIKSFPFLLQRFKDKSKNTADWLQERFYFLLMKSFNEHVSMQKYFEFILTLIIKPSKIVPNLDYDILQDHVYLRGQSMIKNHLSLGNRKDIFNCESNLKEMKFSQLLLDYMVHLKQQKDDFGDILSIFFQVIQKLFYCSQVNLVKFLFSPKSEIQFEGFSASFIENVYNSRNSYIYQREVKTILSSLAIIGRFYPSNYAKIVRLIEEMIKVLHEENVSKDKKQLIVSTILKFSSYEVVRNYVLEVIAESGQFYVKHQKIFNTFLLQNFQSYSHDLFFMINKQPKVIKLFYFLKTKLIGQGLDLLHQLWIEKIPSQMLLDERTENDCYRLNYFFVQTMPKIQHQKQYLQYIAYLIKQGLNVKKMSQIHFLAINLASITLRRLKVNLKPSLYQSHEVKTTFDRSLTSVSNFYIPYTLTELKKQDEIINAQKYLKAIENMVYLLDDYKYCVHLFVGFKDAHLTGKLKKIHDSIIDSIVSKYYNSKQFDQQYEFAEWVLSYYENEDLNNKQNPWNNFRLTIIERMFAKMIHFTKKKVLLQLFHKYTPMLLNIISEKVTAKNVEDMVTQFQIKQGAFIIIQNLYMYLPKPEKEKSLQRIHNQQYHKKIIPRIVEVLKTKYDHSGMILMNEYDKNSGQDKKSMNFLRNYMSAAYNCLIVVFISTQSKVQQFKKYLFDKGEVLWQHLVDPNKFSFDFPVETEFQLMKPIQALSKFQFKNENPQKRIRDEYMQSSLYIIDQQAFPQSIKQKQVMEIEEQVKKDDIKQGSMEKVLKMEIQEDYINKHPCMINLLRVIDYMHKEFYDGTTPCWMKPIYDELMSDDLPLSIRIFLTKIIINRPLIFNQAIMWGQCLIKYLLLTQNGGKFIHYYYRDVLLLLIKYIKNGYKPKTQDINSIIDKLIRCLPHDQNMMIYSSNIDILEEFMKIVPEIYINKSLIQKMLTVKKNIENKNDKKYLEWRMCACIIMKSALIFKVPLVTQQEWKLGKTRNKSQKFYFFTYLVKQKFIKLIEELLFETTKKFRVTAAGFLGQLVRFYHENDPSYTIEIADKNILLENIKALLTNIYGRQENRATKQRLSLLLYYLISRYPPILSDSKVFGMFDTVVVRYKKDERFKLLEAVLQYLNYLVNSEEKSLGYSVELLQTIRTSIDKFISDNLDVYKITIKIIKLYAKPFFLEQKQIFLAINAIFETLCKNYADSNQQSVCMDFFQFVFFIKDYLNEFTEDDFKARPYINQENIFVFKTKIKQSLVSGLGNKFNSVRKVILQHFEESYIQVQSFQSKIIQLLKEIHEKKYQNLWLINSIPLIFSLAKKSSNYNTFLFNKQIEQSAQFYDVDFKNISFHNSSQPYTPAYSFFTNKPQKSHKMSDGSQDGSFIASIGSNRLGGIIRATQNSYMSQQQQVFTILASQSIDDLSFNGQISESQRMQLESGSLAKQSTQEQRNYANMNNIFMDIRKKKDFKQIKPTQNLPKFDSKVNVIGDKIRFKPKSKEGEVTNLFRFKTNKNLKNQKSNDNNQKKIHSSYRSYKVGQMPNVQITVANILQPLVQICCFDKELSSQFFTIFLTETISKNKGLEKSITQWFIELLKNSQVYDFSFISTLQKCLILICEQGNDMIKVNMNQIAIKSNTIDYAIVFTEQNLIKYRKNQNKRQNLSILVQDENMDKFVKSQWSDLIDLYQKISGHAFLPPLLKHITKESEYHKLIRILDFKQDGSINDCYKQLDELLGQTQNSRLHDFLQKQKIDCLALLGQWQPITESLHEKLQRKIIYNQEKRLLTMSLLNSEHRFKENILQKIKFPDQKFEYEKGLISLMATHTDLADYYTGKQIESFYKFFKKTTSFDYNSKHVLLQSIQKVYEMREFISIYRNKEPLTVDILNVMNKWAKRVPNEMFDSDLTWIELLESRMLYTRMLNEKFTIPKEKVVKANTDYMIQVVNQMLSKNIYGCAEVISRKALKQMKEMKIFNWNFFEALSNLKLFEYKKKVVISPSSYELTPKVIFKEITSNNKTDYYSDIKYLSIQNDHFQGFISSCIKAMGFQPKPNIDTQQMIEKINKIYINYQRIKKSFKNLQKQNQLNQIELQKINCKIHVSFSLFLQKIIQLNKGKHQIKSLGQTMQKSNLPLNRLTQIFVIQLIQSISLMNLNGAKSPNKRANDIRGKYKENISGTYNHKEKEINEHKVFEMILKLLKTVQSEKNKVGQIFSQAINDKKLPVWIFVYFIPQIIKTLNSHELVEYFADLFDSIFKMYPESLVYHFNCYFQKQINCFTDAAKEIYHELHKKMDVNFKFIDALESLYHPQKRLKQILQGFYRPGQDQNSIQQLEDFIDIEHKRLGKYNKKFIEQHKPFIRKIINVKKQKKSQNAAMSQIQKLIKMLDPKNKDAIHQMRDFNKISDGSLFFQDYNSNDWNRIQVPATIYSKFQEPLSWNRVFVESFDLSVLTLKSQRKPKRIILYGSNEKKYMFLVKGGEDVRLDQRIEEMFNIMNKIFKNNPECAKKKLEIKRFEVIPIKKMLGIFQWIDETQTLKEVLQKQLKIIHENYNFADMNPAFKQYTQKVRSASRGNARDNTQLYKQFLSLPEEQIVSNLKNCQSYIPFGLLRKTLFRLSKSYDFYLHIKNQFLSNYAVACVVGYVLGIGDRHLQNFLIHGPSASVILIDFGYSFGASRELAVPQLIPFRLTKCFMEIMEPIGYEGIFKQAMMKSFKALQDNKNVIIDFCDVFIDDPLMEWIWKCKRQNPSILVTSEHVSMTISQEPPERKVYSKRIEYVKKKLNGQHPRKILVEQLQDSKHKQSKFFDEFKKAIWKGSKTELERRKKILQAGEITDELITLASDKNILGRCYIGLNPYV